MYECLRVHLKIWPASLFPLVKVCVEIAKLFGWADNRKIVHHFTIDTLNNTSQILNAEGFFFFFPRLPV